MDIRLQQRGFSLIEVLVTTLIFSVGVLGVTALGAVSKRASFEATQRSTASELAYALLEEMRFNSRVLNDYITAGDLGGNTLGAEPAARCDDPAVPCTAAELAAHGLWQWERLLDGGQEVTGNTNSGGLVSPMACINGPAGGLRGVYSVTIVWRGMTALDDAGVEPCGAGSGLYGAEDEFRRVVVVQSYIDPIL